MSSQHQLVHNNLWSLWGKDELIDDATDEIPISGLNTSLSLRDRFMRRLSNLLGGASVQMSEDQLNKSISINITLMRSTLPIKLDKELQQLLRSMECSLSSMAMNSNGMYISGDDDGCR